MIEHVSAGAATPQDLLQQMSLADPDCVAANGSMMELSELDFSGNIISVAFCVPRTICLNHESNNWIVRPRRGTSALFDSFSYLASSSTEWRHTLVGWTGEIERDYDKLDDKKIETLTKEGAIMLPSDQPPLQVPCGAPQRSAHANVSSDLKMSPADRRKLEARLEQLHGGRVLPVWLPNEVSEDGSLTLQDQSKWRRYGEHELFPLFHYKMNDPAASSATKQYWEDYVRMNEIFADRVLEFYHPGDIVLVHDYHLFLLPDILRNRLENAYIGFFLHIPFPSCEYYRCLPKRKQILQGVLGADMIGFQTDGYAGHFAQSCRRVLDYHDASSSAILTHHGRVAIEVLAIGINTAKTWRFAFDSEDVEDKLAGLKRTNGGLKVVVGRDRRDSVRGVTQKLQAFEIFLKRHPQWQGNVKLVQVTSPTSIEDRGGKYDKTESKITELVNRINANFGSLAYQPVEYYASYLEKVDYFALLRIADVALITSVRDGMNTTALEYVVCQHMNHAPLIISEFSGTAGSLDDAIKINPWDPPNVAAEISRALAMSDEEKTRSHDKLYKHVMENNVEVWTHQYIQRLMTDLRFSRSKINTPVLDVHALMTSYHRSERRLFMFDYDGTLTPIVSDPDSATPTDRVVRTLKALASDRRNSVWIVSGRPQSFLQQWLGDVQALGLSAEHGCFMRYPNKEDWSNLTEDMDLSWCERVVQIFRKYADGSTDGTVLECKQIAITWHYRRADPGWAADISRACLKELQEQVEPFYDVEVMKGKMNLEVRPRFVNKGEIAKRLIKEVKGDGPPDFVVSIGDDHTDEGE